MQMLSMFCFLLHMLGLIDQMNVYRWLYLDFAQSRSLWKLIFFIILTYYANITSLIEGFTVELTKAHRSSLGICQNWDFRIFTWINYVITFVMSDLNMNVWSSLDINVNQWSNFVAVFLWICNTRWRTLVFFFLWKSLDVGLDNHLNYKTGYLTP